MKILLRENELNNKVNKLIEIYINLLKENNYKSKDILFLVPNNSTKNIYERKIDIEFSESINITTYLSFIKKEIVKFWPVICENCDKIHKINTSPVFIYNNLSEYIINDKVNEKRNLEGYFEDITSTNKNIAKSINTNINKSVLNKIDFSTIGEKIYLSKKNRDKLTKFSYSQVDEIINYYIDTLLYNGILDNSLSVYIYNNYLLTNELYIKNLKKQINYLIVDSFESCNVAELEFINLLKDNIKELYLNFNSSKDYSLFNNVDMNLIYEFLEKNFDIDKVESIKLEDLYLLPIKINLNESSQLYSEMLEEICKKIIDLINNNVNQNDIAIITPINNSVLDYQIKNILKNNNIDVFNTNKDKKLIDYPYGNILVVASCLFYGYEDYIKEEEYINFIENIFEINKIQALKIYRNKNEDFKFLELKKYIEDKRKNNLNISEFLIQFYIDNMLNLKYGKENINICKSIIQESDTFTENVSLLNLDKNKSKEKIFIEALKSNISDYYSNLELEELYDLDKVVITTPYSYISSNINRPIQIWVDIGSNLWNMKIEKDISNLVVLRQSFKEGTIFTDDMEEKYKKYYLYNMIYNLLSNTKEVYAFKSEYSVNGYIQESILYSIILKILDRSIIDE